MALNRFQNEFRKLKRQIIMNLDKTIKELTNRLDVVWYPYSSSTSNEIKNVVF